jgi:hypothetical protein
MDRQQSVALAVCALLAACGKVPRSPLDGSADGAPAAADASDGGKEEAAPLPDARPQGPLGDPVAVQAGTAAHVFALDQSGALAVTIARSGGWTPWASLGGTLVGTPAAIVTTGGLVQVFARTPDGSVATIRQVSPGAGFTPWISLPSGSAADGDPTAVKWRDGLLALFVRDREGSVWTSWQTGSAADPRWQPWVKMGLAAGYPMAGRVSAVVSLGDYLYLAWRGQAASDVRLLWQAVPAEPPQGFWRDAFTLGHPGMLTIAADPFLGYSRGGLFYVVARASDGAIWWMFQLAGEGGWSGWTSSGGKSEGQPAFLITADHAAHVFVRGQGGILETVSLPSLADTFTSWKGINPDVKLAGDPHAIVNGDGGIQVFARDLAGRLVTTQETRTGSTGAQFTPWAQIGSP